MQKNDAEPKEGNGGWEGERRRKKEMKGEGSFCINPGLAT